jgi:hypothetical protein
MLQCEETSIYSKKLKRTFRALQGLLCDFGFRSFFALAMPLLSSCHLLHSEPKADSKIIQAPGAVCSSQIKESLSNFAKGSATPLEVQTSLACIDSYIERFKTTTRPSASDGSYSLEEVSSFFQQFFGESREFNNQNIKEYFRIKRLTLGGDEARMTREELSTLQNLLREAQPILSDMTQDILIYTLKAKLNLADATDEFKLKTAIQNVYRLEKLFRKYFLGGSGVQYKISNLNNIEILKPEHEKVFSDTESIQIFMSLKSVLVRPPEDSIRGEDFKNLIAQLGLIAETGLRLKYTKDLNDWQGPTFVEQMQLIRNSAFAAIQNAFRTQDHQRIANSEITQLISKLDRYQLLPFGLQNSSIQKFMPELMAKILSPNPLHKVEKDTNLDFTVSHLNIIAGALDEWLTIQKSFVTALDGTHEITAKDLIEKFNINSKKLAEADLLNSSNTMKEVLANGTFLRWQDADVLNFAPRDLNQKFTSYDLIYLSTSFSVIRAVLRGYISDPDRRQQRSLNESEMNDLYMSVRDLGKDLKFIDTRNPMAPGRAFLENNIFTSVSNGNDLVEIHEAIEWFYQVWSAGRVGLKIYNQIPARCKKPEVDVFDRQLLDHDCYNAYFKEHVLEFFGHLPTVSRYLSNILNHRVDPSVSESSSAKRAAQEITRVFNKAAPSCAKNASSAHLDLSMMTSHACSPSDLKNLMIELQARHLNTQFSSDPASQDLWLDFDISLENAFRPTGYSSYDYDSPDIEGMTLIMSYTESLFTNHSRKHSDVLDSKDLWDTFPILKGFIEKASNGAANTEFIQKAAYSYLISFGELPKVNSIWGKLKFGAWAAVRGFYEEKAYVPDIMKVLSSFNEGAAIKKATDIESYFTQNAPNLQAKIMKKDSKTISDLSKLFFCLDAANDYFGQVLSQNAALIFATSVNPLDPPQATKFHNRIESLLRNDHILALQCLPFE